MRASSQSCLVAACLVDSALGHYAFSRLVVNGTRTDHWEYIRNVTTGWAYVPDGPISQYNPYYDVYDENVRCGRGAAASGGPVKTATVLAGDTVGFNVGPYGGDAGPEGGSIYHEGPGQAYMSRVPDGMSIQEYRGDGDWFKMGYIGINNSTHWTLFPDGSAKTMNFKIPETTPPGEYLMRAEHIFPQYSMWNSTQFYINCAHINVVGPGGGVPGPMVKFPGAYDLFDIGIWSPHNITQYPIIDLSKYIPPGPPVWTG